MNPRNMRTSLFALGAILGGCLAAGIWAGFPQLAPWGRIGILVGVWMLLGLVFLYLITRKGRKR